MHNFAITVSVILLAGCGSPEAPAEAPATEPAGAASPVAPSAATQIPGEPDLASCPAREPVEEGLRERTGPIVVPGALRDVMRAGVDNLAFATLGGATVCVDASWMEAIGKPALSADGRFASFDWEGYESFGHVIVDRVGQGQAIDTGVTPVASPSGKLLAAADLGEAGFGALNAFAVWQVEPASLRVLAKHEEVPSAHDWRIERWAGDACLELSAAPWEQAADGSAGARDRFRARGAVGWRLEPGRCPGA